MAVFSKRTTVVFVMDQTPHPYLTRSLSAQNAWYLLIEFFIIIIFMWFSINSEGFEPIISVSWGDNHLAREWLRVPSYVAMVGVSPAWPDGFAKKIDPNVAQLIYCQNVCKKLPKVNNRPMGEISPNLVTLCGTEVWELGSKSLVGSGF
jgi:hypothetical protein